MDKQTERMLNIIGVDSEADAIVTGENLQKYLEFLKENIEMPCMLTGIEDFDWEEYYVLGPGSEKEYKKLKKKYPSYTDEYELIGFNEEIDEDNGIFVDVKRLSDKKKFALPLADLETVNKKSKNAQILDDYSVWFVNYR